MSRNFETASIYNMNIIENLIKIKNQIPENVKLIAVTKTHPTETIKQAINAGHIIFGENKVQELVQKAQQLPSNLEWHMIGHLQTNKVKMLLPYVSLLHSVDSTKLAKEINKEAIKINKIIPCLIQIHIAKEETKFGFSETEVSSFLENSEIKELTHIKFIGLMGMATYTSDYNIIRNEFNNLRKLFELIKKSYFSDDLSFKELSMGMSNDFQIAIEEGSTMIRIGSLIFGERHS